ncbi:uncharacterized protein LOC135131813 [Zophobas morio]|uniref:uncharacterized protein LOC135131813 n=1 Tax=Zophobas morio TaxID=2755281 RepID=UPI00308338AB
MSSAKITLIVAGRKGRRRAKENDKDGKGRKAERLNLISPVPEIDLIGIKVQGNSTFTFVVIYIPPALHVDAYTQIFEYIESAIDFSNPVVIVGDFNIPELVDCASGRNSSHIFNIYSHFISMNNLKQHNSVLNSNNRILDIVLTTDEVSAEVTNSNFPLVREDAHHPCLDINLFIKDQSSNPFPRTSNTVKFNFRKADLVRLYNAFIETDWSEVLDTVDVETACSTFYDINHKLLNVYVPKCSSSAKTYYPPWFTKTIISSIKEKHRLWNLYRKSKLLTYLDRIRILKCDIRRNIRQAYKVFISEAENSLHNDPKKFWSFVNKRRKTTCVPSCMTAGDGVIISNPQDIVNAFASQFASVYTNDNHKPCVASSCNKINCEYCGSCRCSLVSDNPICDNSICDNSVCDNNLIFNLPVINDCDILKAAKKIKPNFVCGPDDIPAFLVIDCLQYLLKPLCHIYNLILKSSIYPQMWKVSRVFPVFKAGDKANIVNYRPIALISNYAKLFECIMSDFLYTHCISTIALEQHGFIKGRSTLTNLCEFTEYVSLALDNRFQVDAIYTDLSKAFDRSYKIYITLFEDTHSSLRFEVTYTEKKVTASPDSLRIPRVRASIPSLPSSAAPTKNRNQPTKKQTSESIPAKSVIRHVIRSK